jgi:protease I
LRVGNFDLQKGFPVGGLTVESSTTRKTTMTLEGKKIAILIAPRGTEEPEFKKPKEAVEAAGAKVTGVGIEAREAKTNNSDLVPGSSFTVDKKVTDVTASNFDGLVIPGGCVGADKLRADADVVSFVRSFFKQSKPVGVICHGPWLLVEADVLKGRTVTSYSSIRKGIENAGGIWVDKEVVMDKGLVTSRKPDDLPAFCAKIIEEFAEGKHPEQARSAVA